MKITCFILALAAAVSATSQDTLNTHINNPHAGAPKAISHEIGFNGTYLIKQALSLSSTSFTTQPYLLTYKLIAKNKLAGRAGVGIYMNNENSTVSGSSTPRKTKEFSFDGRIGAEYRKNLGRRFLGYAGVDFVTHLTNSTTTTVTDNNPIGGTNETVETQDKTSSFGGGPVLGLQYYLTRRISIYTEMPVYFMAGSSHESVTTTSTVSNGFGSPTTTTSLDITNSTFSNLSITIPVTIYIAVKF